MTTAKEKFAEEVKKLPREEKIEQLSNQVYGWDLDCLIDHAKYTIEQRLIPLTDEQLNEQYITDFEHLGWDYDDDDCTEDEVNSKNEIMEDNVCKCPLSFAGIEHTDDCPEYGGSVSR